MLLKWKQDCVNVVALVPINKEQEKIHTSRAKVLLLPGIVEVDNLEWELMKHHLKRDIDNGNLEELIINKQTGNGKQAGRAQYLKDVPPKETTALIAGASDPTTLNRWYHNEVRESVRAAIRNRMEELKVEQLPADAFDYSNISAYVEETDTESKETDFEEKGAQVGDSVPENNEEQPTMPKKETPIIGGDALKSLNAENSIKLIKETSDQDLLMEWLDNEERATVVKAIQKQLDALEE